MRGEGVLLGDLSTRPCLEPAVTEVVPFRRKTVVVAFPLSPEAVEALAGALGSDYVVYDIRRAPTEVDVVVSPPVSPQAIHHLQREFPDAIVLAVELDDVLHAVEVRGPVTRLLDAGLDGYFVAHSLEALSGYLRAACAAADRTAEHASRTAPALPEADDAAVVPVMPERNEDEQDPVLRRRTGSDGSI